MIPDSVRVLHDGGWIHPGGGARVAVEIAKAFDAPIPVGHTECPEWWADQPVASEIAFNRELHDSLSAKVIDRPALRPVAELRLAQLFDGLEIDEEVVISSGTPAKWWAPKWNQTHVHYCHVPPPRFFANPSTNPLTWGMKKTGAVLDRHHADFVDAFVANSEFTRARVEKHYRRDATVVNPPVRTDAFSPATPSDEPYLVHIGRLVEMKRVGLIAEAMDLVESDVQLVMIGDGPLRTACERRENISVYTDMSDFGVEQAVARSRGGLAFAEKEHCGITPKEIQAAGKPVVVPDEPNLCNHVEHGKTGLVADVAPASLADAIDDLVVGPWDHEAIAAAAEDWSTPRFHAEMREVVREAVTDDRRGVETADRLQSMHLLTEDTNNG